MIIYYLQRRINMKDIEAWDMLHGNKCQKKSLSEVLDEMGFDKESYMVVHRNGPSLKIADSYDNNGNLKENPQLNFGGSTWKNFEFAVAGNGTSQVIKGTMNDFEAIDRQMSAYSQLNNNGRSVVGMTGSNNGVYAAMANMGDEFILTKDPEIARQLENQLGFARDELGVPLSNGGVLMDPTQKKEWEMVDHRSKLAAVGRARGTTERPKSVKSPFRDNIGEINKDYAAYRATQLQGR